RWGQMSSLARTLFSRCLKPGRSFRIGWCFCLAGALLAAGVGEHAVPGANPAVPEPPTLHEVEVSIRAQQKLQEHEKLKNLNLFIKVQDGTASVSGPV